MMLADSMDKALLVLNIAEALPVMSGSIMAARDGISSDALWRRMDSLHYQLEELAALARQAKTVEVAYPRDQRVVVTMNRWAV